MSKDTNYPCSYCEFTSKHKRSVAQHIKIVHEKRRDYKCSLCEYAGGTRKDLSYHTKGVHEKIKDIVCEHCDYKCSTKEDLTKHVKYVHKGIKDFKCPMCSFECHRNHRLMRHIEVIHEKDRSNAQLKNHVEAKGKVKDDSDFIDGEPWTCQICGFKSDKVSELARHVNEPCGPSQSQTSN